MADVTIRRASSFLIRRSGQKVVVVPRSERTIVVSTSISQYLVKRYATEAALNASSPVDGTIAYAELEDTHWLREGGAWVRALSSSMLSDATPQAVGAAVSGTSGNASRADHVHAHGDQAGGTLHSAATSVAAGFMSASDKAKLDLVAAGADKNLLATEEAITAVIDPASSTTIAPGTIVTTQAELDALGSSFKYAKDVWDALPRFYPYNIAFTMSAGVHRPRSGDTALAWDFNDKIPLHGAVISFNGVALSSGTQIVAAQTVTAHQNDSGDPYLDFAGTPFAGLSLKGCFAVTGAGDGYLVHEHTDSRLRVMKALSGVTNGSTTIKVVRQATEMRDSTSDTGPLSAFQMMNISAVASGGSLPSVVFTDILFNPMGLTSIGIRVDGARAEFIRCTYDLKYAKDVFAQDAQGIAFSMISGGELELLDSAVRDYDNTADGSIDVSEGFLFLRRSLLMGSKDASGVGSRAHANVRNCVFDHLGETDSAGILAGLEINGMWGGQDLSGKKTEFRNFTVPAMGFMRGSTDPDFTTTAALFKNNSDACVLLGDGARVDVSIDAGAGFVNVSGNSDVGVKFIGASSSLVVSSTSTVTGTEGDIELADGSLPTWAGLSAGDAVGDTRGNLVRRV